MNCIYTSKQIILKNGDLLPYFPHKHTHYMNALHGTSPHLPMGSEYYDLLTYYYPHGLQVLPPSALHTTTPMGFRYYHLQPYILLPPWASGITTISLTNYHPLRLQVLPPSAVQTTVYLNYLYWCVLVFVQLWDSVFIIFFLQNKP